jgi:hypothetical protein
MTRAITTRKTIPEEILRAKSPDHDIMSTAA